MQAGIRIPASHMHSSMIGRGGPAGSAFSATSTLTLSQPNLSDGQQLPQPLHPQQQVHQNGEPSMVGQNREQELDSNPGSENAGAASGDDQDGNQGSKRKRYHRHTPHQIQQMEAFFRECPHPDDKQRREMGLELGLTPTQVKFWFQNKRTQMKTHTERNENQLLRVENEKLRTDNERYKVALSNASCPTCGGSAAPVDLSFEEHNLRAENIRLREEIDRITALAAKYVGKPMGSFTHMAPQFSPRSPPLDTGIGNIGVQPGTAAGRFGPGELTRGVLGDDDLERPVIIELAVAAMEELVMMAHLGEPLWISGHHNSTEVLNEEEYMRICPRGIGPKPFGMKTEASREAAVVMMNHVQLVEMLMDVNQWRTVFSGIVARALTMEVLSTGVAGNYDGALQVMSAEFHLPTPLVPARESYFVRYCKQHSDGTWAIVDVSLDSLRPNPLIRCRRRPSGCLIQEMPNGYSKVTWVEHVEVDDRSVHDIYKPVVNSCLSFGARRWVATLGRQCERLASVMASSIPTGDIGVITNEQGRRSMLKLAERMVISYFNGVSASTTQQWTTLSGTGADDVRVTTRKSIDDPGRPPGIVLSAATSFWMPVPPKQIFDFLREESTRMQWDILANGSDVHEMVHIANGRDQGNCVSLMRANGTVSAVQNDMLILQESFTDPTGSFVIYAPVDVGAMNVVLNGGDPDYVAILPSGFSILPDGHSGMQNGSTRDQVGSGGTLLTVAFQILVESAPTAKLSLASVATVNNLISCTVERIKAALLADGGR